MNGHHEVGPNLSGLLHATAQGHKVVAVSGEKGAHARLLVDLSLESSGNAKHHILLASSALANGARIFPAMAWV